MWCLKIILVVSLLGEVCKYIVIEENFLNGNVILFFLPFSVRFAPCDRAGNLVSKTHSVYNNGIVSNSTTDTYTYGDTTWGALLAANNGEEIFK